MLKQQNIITGSYREYVEQNQFDFKNKINELERKLNSYILENLREKENVFFLNPYRGVGVSNKRKKERFDILTEEDRNLLRDLANKATE